MGNYKKLDCCHSCNSKMLEEVVNLGEQYLTGVFPSTRDAQITKGPLALTLCLNCGLVQQSYMYDLGEMYGDNYGYRSGLNQSMVNHLSDKAHMLESKYDLSSGDTVLDIGSNDGTFLKAYKTPEIKKVGMDPSASKFKEYYTDDIDLIVDFFNARTYLNAIGEPAKLVTSMSMFYDLDDPVLFAREVEGILADNGVWHLEQSYLPIMLNKNSYDTICHEHIEYYTLSSIKYILDKANLKIIDIRTNDTNGGSFALSVTKESSILSEDESLSWYIHNEKTHMLSSVEPYFEFSKRIKETKEELLSLLYHLKKAGKSVYGYGASTKGNVLLQYCGITSRELSGIFEVNSDKFNKFTPGSEIPILSEDEMDEINPDYLLVLPWHFRNFIINKEKHRLKYGVKLIFPLPNIEII